MSDYTIEDFEKLVKYYHSLPPYTPIDFSHLNTPEINEAIKEWLKNEPPSKEITYYPFK